jgi:predicted transposase/invertase (TIGR01784 family)
LGFLLWETLRERGSTQPTGSNPTEEEQDFMRTMEQVDAWYEAEIAKAEQKAKQKARQENQQEIALNLLKENVPLEIISRTTGITISELEGFANEQLQFLLSQLETN